MKIHRGNYESNITFLQKTGLLQSPKRILEIGSGRGVMVKKLRDEGHDAVGTEINPEYIEYAKEENGMELVKISTETTKLPFSPESFDIVVSFDVFEHIPDTKGHLEEVARLLRPGGQYLLATPNKWTNIPFEILKEKSLTEYKKYHVALHNYWQIQKAFEKQGFQIEFVEVPLVTPFFIEKMRKYLGEFGVWLVKVLQPDRWPQFLKTNFYIVATKK